MPESARIDVRNGLRAGPTLPRRLRRRRTATRCRPPSWSPGRAAPAATSRPRASPTLSPRSDRPTAVRIGYPHGARSPRSRSPSRLPVDSRPHRSPRGVRTCSSTSTAHRRRVSAPYVARVAPHPRRPTLVAEPASLAPSHPRPRRLTAQTIYVRRALRRQGRRLIGASPHGCARRRTPRSRWNRDVRLRGRTIQWPRSAARGAPLSRRRPGDRRRAPPWIADRERPVRVAHASPRVRARASLPAIWPDTSSAMSRPRDRAPGIACASRLPIPATCAAGLSGAATSG